MFIDLRGDVWMIEKLVDFGYIKNLPGFKSFKDLYKDGFKNIPYFFANSN